MTLNLPPAPQRIALLGFGDFERSALYDKVFQLAEQRGGRTLPRAVLPKIVLQSPKITRRITTEWFAQHVNDRHQRCLGRVAAPD